MNASPLFLIDYFITDLSFSAIPKFDMDKSKDLFIQPEHLKVEINEWPDEDNQLQRTCRISIESKKQLEKEIPYIFSITIVGFFAIAESWPADQIDRLFSANAPALLYSAAREVIATTTGRGPYSKVMLPSVNFIKLTDNNSTQQSLTNPRETDLTKEAKAHGVSKKKGKTLKTSKI